MTGMDVSDASLLRDPDDPYSAQIQTWPSTYIGFNLSSQDVAAGSFIISAYMYGMWITIWEDCTSGTEGD